MNEDEAATWLAANVPHETMESLDRFRSMLAAKSAEQNLIAQSTLPHFWSRHVVDSAQLIALAPAEGSWIDLGSGAGFPGLVVAAVARRPVTLVESRALRVAFLRDAVDVLGIQDLVTIVGQRLELMPAATFDTISARAFAPFDRLLRLGHRFSNRNTRWILPKGRGANVELADVARSWHGKFEKVASITDDASAIIVATNIALRASR